MQKHLIGLLLLCCTACNTPTEKTSNFTEDAAYQPENLVKIKAPEWSKNAAIYQINLRQFTPEGTLQAAKAALPRLKELGITIVWLMPIHPIGEKNRKGGLGSPYSVRDFTAVNPEFGTLEDLKDFVREAHALGLYVLLDWVANHTAWDNVLVESHPEWYARDWKGDFTPTPWWDWSDIIDLDYSQAGLRKYMTESMKYWVQEADIDGYRCDVAGFVPMDFWNNVRRELDQIKPVFMLAEWESRDIHNEAFDMGYAWSWNEMTHKICTGQADVNQLFIYYSWNESAYPKSAMRMTFVENHDKNAWEGTMWEQFGAGLEAAIVLSVLGEGMPLIHNGQEAGNSKRLAFFEKDPIQWQEHPMGGFYKKLLGLMRQNTALWHGDWGATMIQVPTSAPLEVFGFVRQNTQDKVFVLINFGDKSQRVHCEQDLYHGHYQDFFEQKPVQLDANSQFEMSPWSYKVFVKVDQ
jgi:glycosidase